MSREISEIEEILSKTFNLDMFYDPELSCHIDHEDIRKMIYYTGCYGKLGDLRVSELERFCNHAFEIRQGLKENINT